MVLEKRIAMSAVFKAAQLCQQVQVDMVNTDAVQKADRSPVTVADFGSQALICQAIAEAFPDRCHCRRRGFSGVAGNPSTDAACDRICQSFLPQRYLQLKRSAIGLIRGGGEVGERFWTLDPIDGTKGFLRGDQYAIALALIVNGEVKLGVLGCPNLPQKLNDPQAQRGCLFVAERGAGTRMLPLDGQDSERIHILSRNTPFCGER